MFLLFYDKKGEFASVIGLIVTLKLAKLALAGYINKFSQFCCYKSNRRSKNELQKIMWRMAGYIRHSCGEWKNTVGHR